MTATPRERAVLFGAKQSLAGIVTSIPTDSEAPPRAAVIVLNAGVIHRVGANRLAVRLAREISKLGLPVLRFDQSGLGDSLPRQDTNDLEVSVERDIDEAMTYLERTQKTDRFVFVGLCSGARQSLRTAYRDERVAAALLIDPPAYRTKRSVLTHYGKRALRGESWKNALSGKNSYSGDIINYLDRPVNDNSESKEDRRLPEWPSQAVMKDALQRLLAREMKLFLIYTGSLVEEYNYRDQLRDTFPIECASPHLQWEFMAEADHTFSSEDARQTLLAKVCSWLRGIDLNP